MPSSLSDISNSPMSEGRGGMSGASSSCERVGNHPVRGRVSRLSSVGGPQEGISSQQRLAVRRCGPTNGGAEVQEMAEQLKEKDLALDDCQSTIQEMRYELEAKDSRLKSLAEEIAEKEAVIRDVRVELQSIQVRHEEAVTLSEKYIAEARISRDEEISRLEDEMDIVRREAEERALSVEKSHRDALSSLEDQLSNIKSMNSQLRQDNDSLLSNMKKMEDRARDADRKTQRALNKFEAAVKSLEQLEHQYSLLEADAKETEQVKSSRILALEQEIEEIRLSRAQVVHDGRQECKRLSEKIDELQESLKRVEQQHRRAELSASESTHREKSMKKKLETLEELCEKLKSENFSLREEGAKAQGEIEKLQGSIDGAASASRSVQSMLEAYQKENDELRSEVSDLRQAFRAEEEKRRTLNIEYEKCCRSLSQAQDLVEQKSKDISAEKAASSRSIDSLKSEFEAKEKVWKVEKDALTRELEVLHARVETMTFTANRTHTASASGGPPLNDDSNDQIESKQNSFEFPRTSVTNRLSFEENTNDPSDKEACAAPTVEDHVSQANPISRLEEVEQSGLITPGDGVSKYSALGSSRQNLRDQLTALKLSLLDSTPRHPAKTHGEGTYSSGTEGYLQAHRPHQSPEEVTSADSDASSSSETAEDEIVDVDPLSRARHQVSRAKQYLQRLSSVQM